MPYYMDLHVVPGATAEAVAKAHREDLKAQEDFNCKCITYWVDVDRGRAFCLIDAPNKEAIDNLHLKTLGVKPVEIVRVYKKTVQAFLGRVKDPENQQHYYDRHYTDLKIFDDPAFRIVMVTKTVNDRLLQLAYGKKQAKHLIQLYRKTVRDQLKKHEGREVRGEEFLASFKSVFQAIQCALSIQKQLSKWLQQLDLRIGLHAGMPVTKNQALFGDVVRFGKHLCAIGTSDQIIISPIIRQLYKKEYQKVAETINTIRPISSSDETFLELLMDTLASNWNDPSLAISDFCLHMAMSKSELYRKSKSVTGMSLKNLLKEYRLQKSLELLDQNDSNISQTAFDTGFSSASYFAKCFHKRFGMQPTAYLNL